MDAIKLPANLASNPLVLLLIFAGGGILKELIVAVIRGAAKRMLTDKDPRNDAAAHALEDAAAALDKAGLPKIK
jgi:hypothetical protein